MGLTMAVVAPEDRLSALTQWVRRQADLTLRLSTYDLRGALESFREDPPDALLVHDAVLRENLGWLPNLKARQIATVVVGPVDAEAFRRALAAGAEEYVREEAWEAELPAVFERLLAARQPERHPVVAVFSPKGGVGKSTIASNLACAAAERIGEGVALVDLDLQFGDLSTLLGVEPRATVADVVRLPTLTFDGVQRMLAPIDKTDVQLLASPVNPLEAEEVEPEQAVALLEVLRRRFQAVIVDTALGYTDVNVAALDVADLILLVLTPDVVTVRSVVRTLDLFDQGFQYPREKIRLLVNRDGSGLSRQEIEEALGRPIDFGVPSDG
ncbi:MAG: P-loop NTPase, partial [Firmicutes bacterium]|nr:P-loop NTPase [Bacillota bacterium]